MHQKSSFEFFVLISLFFRRSNCPIKDCCMKLFAKRECGGFISCTKCGVHLRVLSKTKRVFLTIISHACFHLGVALYSCRICTTRFTQKCQVYLHLQQCHGSERDQANVEDLSSIYQEDIIKMIKQCFENSVHSSNANAKPHVTRTFQ